jgi:hypothetical protein
MVAQDLGILRHSIYVYFEDHAPPHFHAVYAEHEAQIKINDSSVLRGTLPPRVMRLAVEWPAFGAPNSTWSGARRGT